MNGKFKLSNQTDYSDFYKHYNVVLVLVTSFPTFSFFFSCCLDSLMSIAGEIWVLRLNSKIQGLLLVFPTCIHSHNLGPSVLRAPAEQTKVATVLGNWSERRCADGV